jgi:hypothetical protein
MTEDTLNQATEIRNKIQTLEGQLVSFRAKKTEEDRIHVSEWNSGDGPKMSLHGLGIANEIKCAVIAIVEQRLAELREEFAAL